jgi:hypothetical protein
MYGSEVEQWLYSIGAQELFDYFLEDGFSSLEAVRQMRQSDIDAIVDRKGYMILLNEAIDRLNFGDAYNTNFVPVPRAVSHLAVDNQQRMFI